MICKMLFLQNIHKTLYGEWYDEYTPSTDITYIPFDMKETAKTYEISIKLPGLDNQEIIVYTDGHKLYVIIDKNMEFYYYNEIDDKSSYRYIVLPEDSSLSDIKFTHTIGLLNIKIKNVQN